MKGQPGHTAKHGGGGNHAGTGKHSPRSPAQQAAAKRWQQAGASARRHQHVVGQHASHAKPAKWTPNADVACCAAEALAASLRLSGRAVSAQEVLDLYWHTASHPDQGATIEATIEAAATYGLAGAWPLDARPAAEARTGVILGVDLAERHALTLDGHGAWTWGAWQPISCALLAAADEAWEVTWSEVGTHA